MGHKLKQPKTITGKTDFYYYMFRNILLVSVPVFFISALLLSVSRSSADTASSDDITLKLDVACTVSSVVSSPHSALDMHVGQYRADIGNTNISVFCNDNNGYSVYAVGNSNNTDGNTDLISNISDAYNIHTGTNTTGNSSWAMKLAAGSGSGSETTPPTIVNGYNSYSMVPNNYTLVATRPSGTSMNPDSSVSGSYFSTTYAIYAASIQPAGTYNGKVKYMMVHPDNSTHNTIPDLEVAFAAAGKQRAYQDSSGNYYYSMQDMDSTICASVTRNGEATATQLVDTRDNKLYWVAKLADDKCWMTENLDLDINSTNTVALTSENTDISTDPNVYTISGIYSDYTVNDGVYTWNAANTATTSGRTITYPSSGNPTVSNWTNNDKAPYSAEGGDTYYYTSGDSNNDIRYTSLQACKDAGHTETECRRYFAGNYYNWTASVASNDSTNISTNNDKATNSICPKGWRLPNDSTTDTIYNEFGRLLYNGYSITTAVSANGTGSVGYNTAANGFARMRSDPLYFVRSGNIDGRTLYNSGVYGFYWSSTVTSGTNSYSLYFGRFGVTPSYGDRRFIGWSVRCIAR